jgi:hypothetical protein
MRYLLISTFTFGALVACSSSDQSTGPSLDPVDQANAPSPARGGHSVVARPLSGRCTTVVSRLAPPPIEVQRVEFTCRMSHLGLSHALVTQTVDVTTGEISSVGDFVAANGDRLSQNFSGTPSLSFIDPTDATVTFRGTQEFSPGTGRFAEATGTADVVGATHLNLITGSGMGELTLDGTLTY